MHGHGHGRVHDRGHGHGRGHAITGAAQCFKFLHGQVISNKLGAAKSTQSRKSNMEQLVGGESGSAGGMQVEWVGSIAGGVAGSADN